MDEKSFGYQKFWARVFSGAGIIAVWIVIQWLLEPYFESSFFYLLFGAVVTILLITVYIRLTEHTKLFQKQGTYRIIDAEQSEIRLQIGKKRIFLQNVTEISWWKNSYYGTYFGSIHITYGKKGLQLNSLPITPTDEFEACSLQELFLDLQRCYPEAKFEKLK